MKFKNFEEERIPLKRERENYSSLDGLRAYAAIGIVLMHVLANMSLKPSANVITDKVIPWFSDFTLLFMVVSAFSMCCGYYEKVKNGDITPAKFYAKRYHRIFPFFAFMVAIAFVMTPSVSTFCQAFADLTMCFNLIPNANIEVIGVGWFLGTIFTFYMLFPFFVFLLDNKRRSWKSFVLVLAFSAITMFQFNDGHFNRVLIIHSAPFFMAGGIAFLYRRSIKVFVSAHVWLVLVLCCLLTIVRFAVKSEYLIVATNLLVFTSWLMFAIGSDTWILRNRGAKYLSGISMEIYLCHMMFYRVVSMMHLDRFVGQCDVLYVVTCIGTLVGAICFSHVVKYYSLPWVKNKLNTWYF